MELGTSARWNVGNQPNNAPCQAGRVYTFSGWSTVQIVFHYLTATMYIRTKFTNWTDWKTI